MSILDGAALYLPIGPPGAGKTTLARRMVKAGVFDHHAIVSPDHFRSVLTGQRGDQSMNQVAFDMCHRIVEERMKRKLPVYFDSTNVRENWRSEAVSHADANNVPVISIVFEIDEQLCRDRNASFDRQRHGAIVPENVMDLMFERYHQIDRLALPGLVVAAGRLDDLLDQRIAQLQEEDAFG